MYMLPGDKYFSPARHHIRITWTFSTQRHRTTAFLTTSPRTALIHVTCALNHRKPLIFAERAHQIRAGNTYDLYTPTIYTHLQFIHTSWISRPRRIASQSASQPTNQPAKGNSPLVALSATPCFFFLSGIRQILKYNWNCNYIEARRNKMKY